MAVIKVKTTNELNNRMVNKTNTGNINAILNMT